MKTGKTQEKAVEIFQTQEKPPLSALVDTICFVLLPALLVVAASFSVVYPEEKSSQD